jgi:tetratricopeptide (TPR) repeat protein
MLNKAFLTQDISVLHKFHFFIKDLHTRLEQMHNLYKPSLASRVFTVYRGLKMTTEDFKKTIRDEINNLIAFDSFLSTSLDPNIAKQFALDKQNPRSESVVFSMEIDADRMERPFADITHWSDFKHEREVLFSIGTVFRIVDVADEKTSDGIWMVYLSTVSEKDAQLQKETQQIQITLLRFFQDVLDGQYKVNNEEKIPGSNANVASMHYKLGEYEHSLVFYKKALTTLRNLKSPDQLTQATYISNVAKVHMALGHDIEALGLYKEALDIRRKICKCNDPSLIHTLHTIGHIYRGKGNLNAAFEQYDEALKLQLSPLDSRLSPDFSSIAVTYICIGNIFDRQSKYPEALKSFLNALEQQQKHLQEEHPVLAFLYNNIGAMHYKMKRYDLALENQLKCLKIELKSLPKEHKTFAETYKNIATAYEKRGQFDEAIEYAQKYVDQLKLHSLEASEELNDAIDLLKRNQRIRDIRK